MKVAEFKLLKQTMRDRAWQALQRLGSDQAPRLRAYQTPKILVMFIMNRFVIQVPCPNYLTNTMQMTTVYEEHQGREGQLGWEWKELIRFYNYVIQEMDSALILEDLAGV